MLRKLARRSVDDLLMGIQEALASVTATDALALHRISTLSATVRCKPL
jgi:hypothetical protein